MNDYIEKKIEIGDNKRKVTVEASLSGVTIVTAIFAVGLALGWLLRSLI